MQEGELVFLCVRGCHKIQDFWSPVVYQVLKTPKVGELVYTLALVDDLANLRHVYHTLLNVTIKVNLPGEIPVGSPPHDEVSL